MREEGEGHQTDMGALHLGGGGGGVSPFLCACCLAGSLAVLPTNGNRRVGRREYSVHVKQTQEYYIWIAILRVSPVQCAGNWRNSIADSLVIPQWNGNQEGGRRVMHFLCQRDMGELSKIEFLCDWNWSGSLAGSLAVVYVNSPRVSMFFWKWSSCIVGSLVVRLKKCLSQEHFEGLTTLSTWN